MPPNDQDQGHDPLFTEALPHSSYDLIDALDRVFRPRCVSPGETMESAHRYAGMRSMIDDLVERKRAEIAGEDEA